MASGGLGTVVLAKRDDFADREGSGDGDDGGGGGRTDSGVGIMKAMIEEELSAQRPPDLARVSLSLGAFEAALTAADPAARDWPRDIVGQVDTGKQKLATFVDLAARKLAPSADTRAKVKAIADLVWGRLGSCVAKEVPHVQHLSAFTDLLREEGGRRGGKRHLDCAGVVSTTLIVAKQLAVTYPEQHNDLAAIHLQVSEDHCWITLSEQGRREDSVEITTQNKGVRGRMVGEAAWAGWLYNGGHAAVCSSPARALAALVVSVNPTIGNRPSSSGPESSELLDLQCTLLSAIWAASPPGEAYPGMAVTLASGNECAAEAALRICEAAGDASGVEALLSSRKIEGILKAVVASPECGADGGGDAGWHWYPHTSLFFFLKHRGDLIIDELNTLGPTRHETGWQHYTKAIAALESASAVLGHFRYATTDEQLCKDITCVLDNVEDILKWRSQLTGASLDCAAPFASLLVLWRSICTYFASLGVSSAWVDTLLRCAKLFTDEARQRAAEEVVGCLDSDGAPQAIGGIRDNPKMRLAVSLWSPLKSATLRSIFESPDPTSSAADGGGAVKRRRRGAA